ncbi:iron-sulfur cluster biosynthesis family protein [Paenibacillus larvae]|uniref:Iron-sulfur cluster biosynthesis family protein n=1 Tax=Paenibacillus larvae TaxID=1464 RepID=A0AAP5JUZ4_9BACL|nr:iron-sulfur cluster biosynthesis family protein [Paenibacillus larvae]AQR77889.1 hypothetical protein BXP28_11640 [Paenibacillus larvae subsp. larvae]AVF20985.1 HesB/YadR/YfhF-family protein [Paenibacillus larvae subsp. larvae]ETK28043.1 HesB/YadR/YfhF-family protein [Paenibacillus larvae subsp. larvae DSM 25719]MCY7475365.1 hypothetical protein [Paenibacillus larvae]MCY7489657.1 hypothetical protein [Paenibacillus larvae]
MHLTITETAERILSPLLQEPSTWLKLVYDIEGCGCAVDGVPALWLVNECKPTDKIARGSSFDVLYNPKQEIFFEEDIKIDYSKDSKAFTLSSPNQIYSVSINLVNKKHIQN